MDHTERRDGRLAFPGQEGGFDFELTDIEDARRTLDQESLAQFDVGTTERPGEWKRLRRAPLPTDRALTGQAIDWLLALPSTLRPQRLSAAFPRIANVLAQVWDAPELCQETLERLLSSERRHRAGFPKDVHSELAALRGWINPF